MRDVRTRAAVLWRTHPREVLGAGLLLIVAAASLITSAESTRDHGLQSAPPAPPPMVVRPLAPDQALKLNAEIPVANAPNPAAAPFKLNGNAVARAQALNCLASAVYYEAGNQDENGERAVAQVVLNRVRHPAFPASVCAVVYQGSTRTTGCQFTFTCDGALSRRPIGDLRSPEMRPVMMSAYREALDLIQVGAYTPGSELEVRKWGDGSRVFSGASMRSGSMCRPSSTIAAPTACSANTASP